MSISEQLDIHMEFTQHLTESDAKDEWNRIQKRNLNLDQFMAMLDPNFQGENLAEFMVPLTNCETERTFSKHKIIYTSLRQSLKPETIFKMFLVMNKF